MMGIRGPKQGAGRPGRRAGTVVTVFFLFALPVLILIMLLALNAALLAEARTALQANADADALAAVGALVDDSWLTGDPARQMLRVGVARSEAEAYAAANKVLGQPQVLELPFPATANPPDGDIVFAHLDKPRSPIPAERVLVTADLNGTYHGNPFLPLVNTVRINARRVQARGTAVGLFGSNFSGIGSADLEARATATLDRDIVGFRPIGGQPIPMAPIALLTRASVGVPSSWENELGKGVDFWRHFHGVFISGSDGLPEVSVLISPDEAKASAALVLLGISDVTSAAHQTTLDTQIAGGITANDLQGLGGVFELDPSNNRLTVAASRGDPSFYTKLLIQLDAIKNQPRIWPLYEIYDAGTGQAVVSGFVAARVVAAFGNATTGLTILLQPCMLATRTALTDTTRRGVGGVNILNPYIAKLRLVD